MLTLSYLLIALIERDGMIKHKKNIITWIMP